jgi:hypothetical protein
MDSVFKGKTASKHSAINKTLNFLADFQFWQVEVPSLTAYATAIWSSLLIRYLRSFITPKFYNFTFTSQSFTFGVFEYPNIPFFLHSNSTNKKLNLLWFIFAHFRCRINSLWIVNLPVKSGIWLLPGHTDIISRFSLIYCASYITKIPSIPITMLISTS